MILCQDGIENHNAFKNGWTNKNISLTVIGTSLKENVKDSKMTEVEREGYFFVQYNEIRKDTDSFEFIRIRITWGGKCDYKYVQRWESRKYQRAQNEVNCKYDLQK